MKQLIIQILQNHLRTNTLFEFVKCKIKII